PGMFGSVSPRRRWRSAEIRSTTSMPSPMTTPKTVKSCGSSSGELSTRLMNQPLVPLSGSAGLPASVTDTVPRTFGWLNSFSISLPAVSILPMIGPASSTPRSHHVPPCTTNGTGAKTLRWMKVPTYSPASIQIREKVRDGVRRRAGAAVGDLCAELDLPDAERRREAHDRVLGARGAGGEQGGEEGGD